LLARSLAAQLNALRGAALSAGLPSAPPQQGEEGGARCVLLGSLGQPAWPEQDTPLTSLGLPLRHCRSSTLIVQVGTQIAGQPTLELMAEVAEGPVPLLRRGLQHQGGERLLRPGDGKSSRAPGRRAPGRPVQARARACAARARACAARSCTWCRVRAATGRGGRGGAGTASDWHSLAWSHIHCGGCERCPRTACPEVNQLGRRFLVVGGWSLVVGGWLPFRDG
jgi:hypothetical protein